MTSGIRLLVLFFILLGLVPSPTIAQESWPDVQALAPFDHRHPMMSPDGSLVVYASGLDFDLDLWLLDPATGQRTRLTDTDDEDSAPYWSPDGVAIAFQRENRAGNRDLWVVDVRTGHTRNVTGTDDVREQHPSWSSDGRFLYFDSNEFEPDRETGGDDGIVNYDIVRLDLENGSRTRLTDGPGWEMYPEPAPDGGSLLWRTTRPGAEGSGRNFDIVVRRSEGGSDRILASDPAYDSHPRWSPDGDWIVFESGRTGVSELFLVRPDGSGTRRITNAGSGSMGYSHPRFTPDGRVIANRHIRGVTDIVIIDLEGDVD